MVYEQFKPNDREVFWLLALKDFSGTMNQIAVDMRKTLGHDVFPNIKNMEHFGCIESVGKISVNGRDVNKYSRNISTINKIVMETTEFQAAKKLYEVNMMNTINSDPLKCTLFKRMVQLLIRKKLLDDVIEQIRETEDGPFGIPALDELFK